MESDKKLIEEILKNNDYDSYAQLVEKYSGNVFSYVYKITENYHLSEDIVQETFMKAFKYLSSFDERKDFLPWILKIAKNTAYTYLRKQNKYVFPAKSFEAKDLENKLSEEEVFFRKAFFFQLIDDLQKEEKELLLLRFVLEMSHAQISELTGLKEGTIRSKISRSLKKLKERWKDKDELL